MTSPAPNLPSTLLTLGSNRATLAARVQNPVGGREKRVEMEDAPNGLRIVRNQEI